MSKGKKGTTDSEGGWSVSIQHMLICAVHPGTQILVAIHTNEGIAHTIPESQILDFSPEPRLHFLHQLGVRHAGMHPDGDEVVCHAVKNLDFDERCLRIGGGNGGCSGSVEM